MFGILSDLVQIAVAPVRIAANMTEMVVRPITKPLADSIKDIADTLKQDTK